MTKKFDMCCNNTRMRVLKIMQTARIITRAQQERTLVINRRKIVTFMSKLKRGL